MTIRRISLALLALMACAVSPTTRAADHPAIPAFPGAEGFGAMTPGGRGGKVIVVTTLADSGPGSLRAACNAKMPRIIVFAVAGTIDLKGSISVKQPFATIAGQTAPGDGICLRNYPLVVEGHDIVVRYLRSRLGDKSKQQQDSIDLGKGAKNVILDHCSATWSVDEALSLMGKVSDATVQWCLIAEGLNHSIHSKGDHGYGSLARADGPVSLLHNLWAHNNSRNPRLGDDYNNPPYPTFDVRGNVMYDYGEICSGLTQGQLKVNYVNNYIKPGPSSKADHPIRVGGPSDLQFYIQGNVFDGHPAMTADNSLFFDPVEIDGKKQIVTVPKPFDAPPIRALSARESYDAVLASVGASLPRRDSVDARIIREVRDGTGKIIDSQDQVGGWPELSGGTVPADSDGDGMPDAWETQHGLNPKDAADASADKDGDGYTNIEEWLNATDPAR